MSIAFSTIAVRNVAHVLVTQQLLCYKLSSQEMTLDESFIDLFKKGSVADYEVNQEELDFIKLQQTELTHYINHAQLKFEAIRMVVVSN